MKDIHGIEVQPVTTAAYTGPKKFTIHEGDAGSEAYRDQYVRFLESSLTASEKRVAELEPVYTAAALLATCDEYDLDRNYEALMQLVKP